MNEPLPRPPGPPPDAVLFDLFHTLIELRPGGDLGPPTWERLKIPREAYRSAFYREDDGRATGQVRDAFTSLRMVAHRVDPTIPESLIETAVAERRRRFEDAFRNVGERTLAGLDRLRSAGVRLVLVSNVSWDEIDHWESSPLSSRFDAAVFSCAVGVAKPDAGIYLEALEHAGTLPDRALFAGDGGSNELEGAANVGLVPVLVSHVNESLWPERTPLRRSQATYEVHDALDLAEAVSA